jgi:hypothetical protein
VSLEDPAVKALLADLIALTGEDEAQALKRALEERLQRVKRERAEENPTSDILFGY